MALCLSGGLYNVLEALCPVLDDSQCSHYFEDEPILFLLPDDGPTIPCHRNLLRARCPQLPRCRQDGVVEVAEKSNIVLALLRWIYFEEAKALPLTDGCGNTTRDIAATLQASSALVRLAQRWGVRDVVCLQQRLTGRKTKFSGTLQQDILGAYDSHDLEGRLAFDCPGDPDGGDSCHEASPKPLYGGWIPLLCGQSAYFDAMLRGAWAEGFQMVGADRPVTLRLVWPREQLKRLLRFLHGGDFVLHRSDLSVALECAAFFGVPRLLESVVDWVIDNLKVGTASELWTFMDSQPFLGYSDATLNDLRDLLYSACFDFHIRHFLDIAQMDADSGKVPLHDLSPSLMESLMASGLVDVGTRSLRPIIARFVRAHCGDDKDSLAYHRLHSQLVPPAVLFNRENVRDLTPSGQQLTARAFLG